MSKGQRGNKEAKKPKKTQEPPKPLAPAGTLPEIAPLAQERLRKK